MAMHGQLIEKKVQIMFKLFSSENFKNLVHSLQQKLSLIVTIQAKEDEDIPTLVTCLKIN